MSMFERFRRKPVESAEDKKSVEEATDIFTRLAADAEKRKQEVADAQLKKGAKDEDLGASAILGDK
jgi:hypothetical protein